jgi:hypothetical protein
VTVFSATNYCGAGANKGAILQVGRRLEMVPKTIVPREERFPTWDSATNAAYPPSPVTSPRASPLQPEPEYDGAEMTEESDQPAPLQLSSAAAAGVGSSSLKYVSGGAYRVQSGCLGGLSEMLHGDGAAAGGGSGTGRYFGGDAQKARAIAEYESILRTTSSDILTAIESARASPDAAKRATAAEVTEQFPSALALYRDLVSLSNGMKAVAATGNEGVHAEMTRQHRELMHQYIELVGGMMNRLGVVSRGRSASPLRGATLTADGLSGAAPTATANISIGGRSVSPGKSDPAEALRAMLESPRATQMPQGVYTAAPARTAGSPINRRSPSPGTRTAGRFTICEAD